MKIYFNFDCITVQTFSTFFTKHIYSNVRTREREKEREREGERDKDEWRDGQDRKIYLQCNSCYDNIESSSWLFQSATILDFRIKRALLE